MFRMKKESAVIGTCEAGAFILSLRDSNEFSKTHSSGYHCIPHIGEYVIAAFSYAALFPSVFLCNCSARTYKQLV